MINFISKNLISYEELSNLLAEALLTSGQYTVNLSTLKLLNIESSCKKTVRFHENVQQLSYNIDSAIIAKTAKNKRKAAKKKRALEKKNSSESDASSLEEKHLLNNLSTSTESCNDSGLASSFEESLVISDNEVIEEEDDSNTTAVEEYIFNIDDWF